MYGKLFTQMYDGTLATRGPWQALVTFQQLVILADKTGIVDMTAESIARRTTVPLDIILIGITALEVADPESRSPDEDGRRIVRLSDDRIWGWRIVNYEHYRKLRSQDERREYMRTYQQKRRASVNSNVNNVSNVNQSSKQYAVSSKQITTTTPSTAENDPVEDVIASARSPLSVKASIDLIRSGNVPNMPQPTEDQLRAAAIAYQANDETWNFSRFCGYVRRVIDPPSDPGAGGRQRIGTRPANPGEASFEAGIAAFEAI